MIRILIHGCSGKMGRMVAELAAQDGRFSIVAGVDQNLSGEFPFPTYHKATECPIAADVAIDFTRPESLGDLMGYCVQNGTAAVVATTGLGDRELSRLALAAQSVPVLRSANLSLGVNLLQELCQRAAAFLGDGYDIEITETHHNQKVDAPSGTALALADSLRAGLHTSRRLVFGRHGKNEKRMEDEIGIHALRGGNVVGEHNIYFFGGNETVHLAHSAQSRALFAQGALRAAEFLSRQLPGMYSMKDLLLDDEVVSHLHVDLEQALVAVTGLPADPGCLAAVFDAVSTINIDMIDQSPASGGVYNVSFTCSTQDASAALEKVNQVLINWPGASCTLDNQAAKLTLEGRGMARRSGVAAQAFRTLAGCGAFIKSITTSETKISCLIAPVNVPMAEAALREAFNLPANV
nr:4-hydroxy-tetrahydrodipicolinate reductase [bacterium]